MSQQQSKNANSSSIDEDTAPKKKSKLRKLMWCVQWVINLCVLCALLIVFTPAGKWAEEKLISVDKLEKGETADYIVVLGGNFDRTVEAARLYREGWAPKIIVTSTGANADDMADLAMEFGVPRADIIVEPNSTRTAEHPAAIAALPGVDKDTQKFIILTSALHTSRARGCFDHNGFKNIIMTSPAWRYGGEMGLEADSPYLRFVNLPAMSREAAGWGLYKTMGWL
ncbi:MAG: YdcF family protein [Phycisphaerae bacterium]|nr:YdcF family protein [Phycisphaerae bacterium]